MLIGGTAIATFAGYISYIVTDLYRPHTKLVPKSASAQADVSSRYNSIAHTFDATVDSNEYWLGVKSLRRSLVAQARGDVLEVSIGTGRNLELYDWDHIGFHGIGKPDAKGNFKKGKVRSFTAVDVSLEMLTIAHGKLEELLPNGKVNVRWVLGDAAAKGVIPEPPQHGIQCCETKAKYDTVVQTMGLCSVHDPVNLLKNLGDHVKEEEGRILLLEHGRGRWKWLNALLDRMAESHAQAFGCWWNRDVPEIIEASGLEVVEMKTPKWWHGGTTWWIELKKPKSVGPDCG